VVSSPQPRDKLGNRGGKDDKMSTLVWWKKPEEKGQKNSYRGRRENHLLGDRRQERLGKRERNREGPQKNRRDGPKEILEVEESV